MDILQPLPIEKWSELKDSFKRNWPAYAYCHNYVSNSIKWKTKDPSLKIEFYCPNGRADTGVFIGKADYGRKSLFLFSFDESIDLLLKVLRETNWIDWSDTFMCMFFHEKFHDALTRLLEEHAKRKGLKRYTYLDECFYFKSKEDCLKIDLQIPEECKLKRIDETYVPLIHSVWPHRNVKNPEKTMGFMTKVARLNGGYGLFLKKDNSLISWIMQSNLGSLGILQTLEEHKGKGYGKTVTQAQMKYLAEKEDLDSTALVIRTNEASHRLFESLGFVNVVTLVSWRFGDVRRMAAFTRVQMQPRGQGCDTRSRRYTVKGMVTFDCKRSGQKSIVLN